MRTPSPSLFQFLGHVIYGDLGPYTFYTTQRRELIFYAKAPQLAPPSAQQIVQMAAFSNAAIAWNALQETTKANWELATKRLSLGLTGYNLYTWWSIHQNDQPIRTIERQSRLTLLP